MDIELILRILLAILTGIISGIVRFLLGRFWKDMNRQG